MSNPWDDEFKGSGSLDAAWSIANNPINPLRVGGRASWSSVHQAIATHHAGIMKPLPGTFLYKDFVTKVGYGGLQDTNMGAGMSFGSRLNGPGACVGMWMSSTGPGGSYVWVVLGFSSYSLYSTTYGTHAATPGRNDGYIRMRTPAIASDPVDFQFSDDGVNFTTVASQVVDFNTLPDVYLHAGEGTAQDITPAFDFVRCLEHGARVVTNDGSLLPAF